MKMMYSPRALSMPAFLGRPGPPEPRSNEIGKKRSGYRRWYSSMIRWVPSVEPSFTGIISN
jgi:hypothetical protein